MNLAQMIDHTLLKPDATEPMIAKLCDEAIAYGFKAVCVNPFWVRCANEHLKKSEVAVCTVIGFPLGATTIHAKVEESLAALTDGATEFDMVINVGALKCQMTDIVRSEIAAIVEAVQGKIVKVIVETCLLTDAEKLLACTLAKDAGAHFVKTSTGFSASGATVADVALMRKTVGKEMGVKASGGVRDLKTALEMVSHGANRIGTSSGVSILSSMLRS